MKTCIVVPCYNEDKRICLNSFLDFLKEHEDISFMFVNDGSSDKTLEVLNDMSQLSSRVNFLDLPINKGKAEAVRQGMLHAHSLDFTHIGYLDADLTIPLRTARDLINTFNETNTHFTFAARTNRFKTKESQNLPRQTIGYVFSFISKRLIQLPVTDTQCGAKFFKASIVPILFEKPFLSRWIFDVEIFFRFKAYFTQMPQYYFHEYPLLDWQDNDDSKIRVIDYMKVPYNLISVFIHYRVFKLSLSKNVFTPMDFEETTLIE
jgi:dolichyl-phosphate beta-glucosyltransferase